MMESFLLAAQSQNAVHVIQIGNTFYDVQMIPIANPSASVARCHHHSHCRRGSHIRNSYSNSSLNANSHTNPTFVLDEGVFPSGEPYEDFASFDIDFNSLDDFSTFCWPWSSTIIRWSHSIAQSVSKAQQLKFCVSNRRESAANNRRNRSQRTLHNDHHVSVTSCYDKSDEKSAAEHSDKGFCNVIQCLVVMLVVDKTICEFKFCGNLLKLFLRKLSKITSD